MPTSQEKGNTLESYKRSYTNDTLIDALEASTLLGVHPTTIKNYVKQGILRRLGTSRQLLVSMHDVTTAIPYITKAGTLVDALRAATKAAVQAAQALKRLDRVETLLGIDAPTLSVEEDHVTAVYRRCKNIAANHTGELPAHDVLDLAFLFYSVTEEYLSLVAQYTTDPEPWAPFLYAAQKIEQHAPTTSFSRVKELEAAYAYLRASRKHLRQVAYFYIREEYGTAMASSLFPELRNTKKDTAIIHILQTATAAAAKKSTLV